MPNLQNYHGAPGQERWYLIDEKSQIRNQVHSLCHYPIGSVFADYSFLLISFCTCYVQTREYLPLIIAAERSEAAHYS